MKTIAKFLAILLLTLNLAACGDTNSGGSGTPNIVFITDTPLPTTPAAVAATPSLAPATVAVTTTAVTTKPPTPSLVVNADNTYTVKSGDTLLGLAVRLGVDLDDLIALNNIKDPNSLQIGQVLKLPPRKTPTPTPKG